MPIPLALPTREELQNLCDSGQWHAAARRGRDLPVAPGGDAEALHLAGSAARRLGHLAQAAANLQAAVALDPESGAAWRELGMTWYDLRRLPVAEHAWGQAARLGVSDPAMEQAWDAVLVVTGRKELDQAAILKRARSFDHIAGLPSVKQWISDDTIRFVNSRAIVTP